MLVICRLAQNGRNEMCLRCPPLFAPNLVSFPEWNSIRLFAFEVQSVRGGAKRWFSRNLNWKEVESGFSLSLAIFENSQQFTTLSVCMQISLRERFSVAISRYAFKWKCTENNTHFHTSSPGLSSRRRFATKMASIYAAAIWKISFVLFLPFIDVALPPVAIALCRSPLFGSIEFDSNFSRRLVTAQLSLPCRFARPPKWRMNKLHRVLNMKMIFIFVLLFPSFFVLFFFFFAFWLLPLPLAARVQIKWGKYTHTHTRQYDFLFSLIPF